ncbi:MAG: hypothetical protein WCX27_00855 [Candidatus Paceibacterota bacterium]|jgi:hypothetical protein
MSKKISTIIIILVILGIIGGLLFFYFRNTETTPTQLFTEPTTENPFGSSPVNKTPVTTNVTDNGQSTIVKNTAKLIQVYKNPNSGAVFFTNKNQSDVLRFIDRATGNAYEYIPESQTGEASRITNTTIPKIEEAIWSLDGNSVVLRYLDNETDNIVSFSAKISISSSTAMGEMNGSFLAKNIKELVTNPSGNKIFELLNKTDGGSYGITASFDGSGKKQTFDSPVSFWNISWPKEGIITLTTKPSFQDPGFLFFFNTQTGLMDRVLGNIAGLSTLTNNDASLVAYSTSESDSFTLDVYDVKKKTSSGLSMQTLADKCVWGVKNSAVLYCAVPQGPTSDSYPDAWYQGTESFNDAIWSINMANGATTLLYQTETNDISFDAFDLKVSANDRYLSFSSKNDLSLWLLDIRE